MTKYILSLDQGTTSSRSIVFDSDGQPIAMAQREFRQIYPQPGYVEHDPNDIITSQIETAKEAIAKAGLQPSDISAIGITNQRETTIMWEKETGRPIYNAIVWQCRRTAPICDKLKEDGYESMIFEKTGLKTDAYFSATKIKWILDNVPGAREKAQRGDLLFGTVDTYILWCLTGIHATDYTNAARTMLFNISTLDWDDELLRLFDIPGCLLPQVYPSVHNFGMTKKDVLGAEIPVTGIAGDQHAALFGQCCFEPGDTKNTYGTGCFLIMNTGDTPRFPKNGMLTTIAWGTDDEVVYALEGSVFVGGAVLQWLRDEMGLIKTAKEADIIAENTKDSDGVVFVPAFTGLGAPYWDMYSRGTISGLTRGTKPCHIIRAALESIALQSYDVLKAMTDDLKMPLPELRVDGGASRSDFLMQLQADLLKVPVNRPLNIETTAQGVAFMAGLGAGIFSSKEEIKNRRKTGRLFKPEMSTEAREKLITDWHNGIGRTLTK